MVLMLQMGGFNQLMSILLLVYSLHRRDLCHQKNDITSAVFNVYPNKIVVLQKGYFFCVYGQELVYSTIMKTIKEPYPYLPPLHYQRRHY